MYPVGLTASFERMKRKLKKVVFKTSQKKDTVFAFIDAQNIAKGIESAGWKIDWSAFRNWLAQKYNVSQAYMYIGYMAENEDLYLQLNNNGFNIDLKQTLKTNNQGHVQHQTNTDVKGNVDVDLTVGVWREYKNYDKAIIVSGDGDFTSLVQYLLEEKKLKNIIVPQFYSSLFKQFSDYIIELSDYRNELTYVKNKKPKISVSKNSTNTKNPLPKTEVLKALDRISKPNAVNSKNVTTRKSKRQVIKQKISLLSSNHSSKSTAKPVKKTP